MAMSMFSLVLLWGCGPRAGPPAPLAAASAESAAQAEGAQGEGEPAHDGVPAISSVASSLPPSALPDCVQVDEDAPLSPSSDVDILDLASSSRRFTVEHPQMSVLDTASTSEVAALQAHMAADPAWRLHERGGVLVAEQRWSGSVPATGYHESGNDIWRVLVRFSPWPDESHWASSPLVSTAEAASGQIVLRGFVTTGGGLGTAASIQGAALTLELLEITQQPGRPRTAQALGEVLAGISWQIHAPGSNLPVDTGGDRLTLSVGADGEGELNAWLNAGESGTAWVRLLGSDGQPLQPDAVACASAERIGWSSVSEQRFYLQGRVPVPEAAQGEVWFRPDADTPPRLLFTAALP